MVTWLGTRVTRSGTMNAMAYVWVAAAMTVNGLVFRGLGGFDSAGRAVSRWGDAAGRRWIRRHGLHSLRR